MDKLDKKLSSSSKLWLNLVKILGSYGSDVKISGMFGYSELKQALILNGSDDYYYYYYYIVGHPPIWLLSMDDHCAHSENLIGSAHINFQ